MSLIRHDRNDDMLTLKSRIADLESRLAEQMRPQGTGLSQYYNFVRAYFPPWLLLAGCVIVGGIELAEVYIGNQSEAVATRAQQAKKFIADAERDSDSSIVDGMSAAVRKKQAEIATLTQENEKLKLQAAAMESPSGSQTLQQRKIKAQIALQSAEAELQKIAADAKSAEDGLRSLEEKASMTKLVATELEAIQQNLSAHINDFDMNGGNAELMTILCGNKYAALIGCPENYVRRYGNLLAATPAAAVATTQAPAVNPRHLRRTRTGANVRPCMSTDNRRCKPDYQLGADTEVNVIEVMPDGWAKVEYAGEGETRQGYMRLSVFTEE